MTPVEGSTPSSSKSYWITRFMILRLLGGVYAVAFLVATRQLVPLVGENGLTPARAFLDRAHEHFGSTFSAFVAFPSLFWLNHSDLALQLVSWIGLILGCVVLAGYANALVMFVLWALYLSVIHIGQRWYGYGWEIQLTETGFLAIFLCPLLDGRPFPRRAPPLMVIWLFRWLTFRIMLGAGLIKIRGDPAWRDLTALNYHFETQPIPNPLSRWFHFLPHPLLKSGVVFNHIAELLAPWFVFWPVYARRVAGAIVIIFQFTLILSGNLSFLNWLTIVPALACFDDGLWARIVPRRLMDRANLAATTAAPSRGMEAAGWAVTALVAFLSIQPIANMLSARQIMNTSFDPLNLVNTYGAFGSVGRERLNVVFEGTDADNPYDPNARWQPYSYVALPVDLSKMPPQIAPYQPRLDWQMWFASMATPQDYPWTLNLVWKLLHNDPKTLGLFAKNPFPDTPPKFVRATLYRYQFASPGNPDGAWWTREELGEWLPPLSSDDPRLLRILRQAGWISDLGATAQPRIPIARAD
jgi:hypothetical protein